MYPITSNLSGGLNSLKEVGLLMESSQQPHPLAGSWCLSCDRRSCKILCYRFDRCHRHLHGYCHHHYHCHRHRNDHQITWARFLALVYKLDSQSLLLPTISKRTLYSSLSMVQLLHFFQDGEKKQPSLGTIWRLLPLGCPTSSLET